jgi:cell division protease FtsH
MSMSQPASPKPPSLDRPSRPKDSERTTRRPAALWDRVKLVLLLVGVWFVTLATVWSDTRALAPPFRDVLITALDDYGWILLLALVEVVRQVHYRIEESSAGYYRFWQKGLFGAFQRKTDRVDEWTRFRIARAFRIVVFLVLLSILLGQIFNVPALTALIELPGRIVAAAPLVFQLLFGFFFVILQFVGLFWFLSRGGVDTYMPDDIETRFTDVKGQDSVLDRVKENMIFLDDPESIEDRGGYVPGGILLWGPPGTGKTLMAQAVAGETAKPFVFVDPGAFINMFMGVGILKVKGLYRKLRRLAGRYGGVIVFFDEADSLGNRGGMAQGGVSGAAGADPWATTTACNGLAYLSERGRNVVFTSALPRDEAVPRDGIIAGLGGGGNMGTLQALLSEMSGLKKPRGFVNRYVRRLLGMKPKPPPKYRILHIFATNMPQSLDEAMLRPGRIDRIYKVGFPHKDGRIATYEYYLDRITHDLSPEQVERLATISAYSTGASIQDVVNEALVISIRDGRGTVTYADILRAKQLKEHGVPDDFEYVRRERHAVAVHEACHAVVAFKARQHAVIDIATIERRGDVGGFVSYIPPEELFTEWKSEREIDIMGSLASLAGERMFFDGDNSAGVGGDMGNATRLAILMEGYHAMGSTIASHAVTKFSVTRGRGSGVQAEDGQDRSVLESEFGKRIETLLDGLYQRTWTLLDEERASVLGVAHALETHRTVTGEDVAAIIDGVRGPFIDGHSYKDPEFLMQLEAYHASALEAHKAHGDVEGSLPIPVPPPPVDVVVGSRPSPNGGKPADPTEPSPPR